MMKLYCWLSRLFARSIRMSTKKIQIYEKLLYLTKFIIDEELIKSLIEKIKSLKQLGIKDESIRVTLIDNLNLFLVDFKNVELKSTGENICAQTTRKLAKRYLLLVVILFGVNTLKNLVINLINNNDKLSLFQFTKLHKIAASISLLSSLTPLVKHLLAKYVHTGQQTAISSFLTTYTSLTLFPDGFPKDYIAVYSFFYGIQSLASYLNDEYKLGFQSSLFLISLSLAELYHSYIIHPEHSPRLIKNLFDYLLKDLFESKPTWMARGSDWPSIEETIFKIRSSVVNNSKKVNSVLIHSELKEITTVAPHPLHTNKLLSITNPSEPNLIKIILKYVPKKLITLLFLISPFFILKEHYKDEEFKISTFKEKLRKLLKPLKSSLKLSSTIILSVITAFVLTIRNNGSRRPIKNFRIIGGIAGLWSFLYYKSNANEIKPITTFIARVTLLSLKRRLQEKYSLKYIDPLLGGIGFSTLVTLYESQLSTYIEPSRLVNYLALIV